MDDKTFLKLEQARKKIFRCTEFMNIIDKHDAEVESIKARLEVAESIEDKAHDDIKFIAMAPEKIAHNESIISKTTGKLFALLGIGL